MKGFCMLRNTKYTFCHGTDHDSGHLLWAAHIALLNHLELLLGPALVLGPQFLLQHWVSLVDVLELLLVGPELTGLQDDDEKREASQSSYGKHHSLLRTKLDHCLSLGGILTHNLLKINQISHIKSQQIAL